MATFLTSRLRKNDIVRLGYDHTVVEVVVR